MSRTQTCKMCSRDKSDWRRGDQRTVEPLQQFLLLLKPQNKGNFEHTVMAFVGTCCFFLMHHLFIHFQFALPSITSDNCPLPAPVSTSKKQP